MKPNSQVFDSDASQPQHSLFSSLSFESLGQFLIHMPTMTDGHQANDSRFLVDSIDNAKAANAILAQSVEFPLKRLSTFGVSGNGTNGGLDRPFQIGMERSNHPRYMWRDIRTEKAHAERRFLPGTSGSPNTSPNDSPLFFLL